MKKYLPLNNIADRFTDHFDMDLLNKDALQKNKDIDQYLIQ
jgi:hypothetical protein